jgi:DNA-binding transcriptional LysR family regulator
LDDIDMRYFDVVDLRDLRTLLSVVRHGSFTAAAAELGYTQSAVSQHVASLERELDQQLLLRRPVRPTPAGERLAEHASRILVRLDVAISELGTLSQEPSRLRVVASPLAGGHLLSVALREVRAVDPSLRVTVQTVDPAVAVGALASGKADAALVDGVVGPHEPLHIADAGLLSSVALREDRLVVAFPADHPLGRMHSVDLDTLTDGPWIVAPGLTGPDPEPRNARARRGGALVHYEGAELVTLLSLVAAGLGIVLLPALLPARVEGVITVPVGSPPRVHRTEVLTLRAPSRQGQLLVDALRAAASYEQAQQTDPHG